MRLGIVHLATKAVPTLLHLLVGDGRAQLHLNDAQVVETVGLNVVEVAHRADALLQDIRHLHLDLMRRGAGIGGDDHRHLHLHLGVLKLGHPVDGEDTSGHQDEHQEVDQELIRKGPFAEIDHKRPPTLVSLKGGSGVTRSPVLMWLAPVLTTISPGERAPSTTAVPSVWRRTTLTWQRRTV